MYDQNSVKNMIHILETQIEELNSDLIKVEHRISRDALKIGISQLEGYLKNTKAKLTTEQHEQINQ